MKLTQPWIADCGWMRSSEEFSSHKKKRERNCQEESFGRTIAAFLNLIASQASRGSLRVDRRRDWYPSHRDLLASSLCFHYWVLVGYILRWES
ncbi:hypothetical protein ASPWEDRAFT_42392 [Aspergillus wentii DTO 134E9]|uniref:Uncharacterized protein n=1 Tax=Aspergillus wentii DTO 134E9 TaxID=1073089 RepID=A0A1L9RHJ8_ASPWE|nr:uncharacterized protein ASPWEDRAFT_42392 [Aspergillus wentii DTO 134E9]OJJ34395.1 hypothetical protein ASPWEDRAFT_42392 [Aspergillus wentii DTO 134E9]